MKDLSLLLGQPGDGFELGATLASAFATGADLWRARFGFAYVSSAGLDALLPRVEKEAAWRGADKRWILGIHHGITEPIAVKRLREVSNTQVRLFVGGKRLTAGSLAGNVLFHGKLAVLQRGEGRGGETCVLAGSANLTGAALGSQARNYEVGLVAFNDPAARALGAEFERWWSQAWRSSLNATDSLLAQYSKLRGQFVRRNPDALADLDPPSPPRIGIAGVLWIEAGAMSGGSRNQVEFNRELAGFFGRASSSTRQLRIVANKRLWDDRPLSPKRTSFGVEIWRLSLPTEAKGGFAYPGRVLRFRRKKDAQGVYFELSVAAADSLSHRRWAATAHREGYVGVTSGQRAYGFHG